MRTDMITFARLFLCMMDTYMLYRFFKSMFPVRIGKTRLVLYYVGITLLIFFENALVNPKLNLIMIPLFYLVYVSVSFKISIANRIVYTIIFYEVFVSGKEVAFELLLRQLESRSASHIMPFFTTVGIEFLLVEYLFSFLFLLYIERFTKKLEISESRGFAWYLLIVPTSSMFVLISLLHIDIPESYLVQGLICGSAFLMYFSNAVIFIVLAKYTIMMNQMKYEELYNVKRILEDEQYQSIVKLNERYRCYMHDIGTYLRNIRMLALQKENQSIVEIIDELEGEIREESNKEIYNGNKVLNAVLSECRMKAKKEEIDILIFVEKFLKVNFISDADMISMFGNLLDNALEAAVKCEKGKRKVDVKLFMGNPYILVLYIENTFVETVLRNEDIFLTTKKNIHFHGIGIGIVKKLAEKYGGTLCLEEEENKFKTTLTVSKYGNNGLSANIGRETAQF